MLQSRPLSVIFDGVEFRYQEDAEQVLKKVSFTINAGEKVAIVGRNGMGKSTLVKLILRLYDPTAGQIVIDGKKIDSIDVKSLREQVGVAFQDSMMYAFNVKENVGVYDENMSEEVLKEVFRRLELDEVLKKHGAEYQSHFTRELDDKGIELSGGERQLVAIARVLTRKFGLLIFDEPSSSLDPVREYKLSKMIMHETGDSTVILISHRLSSVKDADKILMVEDGAVVECGTHQELMELGGKYSELYWLQAEGYAA